MIGTPGRYVRNGKRHKEQKPSKKTAVVCAWVSGRGSRDVSSLRDRLASEWDGQRASRNLLGGFKGAVERGLCVSARSLSRQGRFGEHRMG
jgi:hypothetical protein